MLSMSHVRPTNMVVYHGLNVDREDEYSQHSARETDQNDGPPCVECERSGRVCSAGCRMGDQST